MNKLSILFICQLLSFAICAQNLIYSKKIIDTLTSPFFSGRGAVKNGEKKAANYIANEYQKNGLNAFNNSFFQEFTYSLNTFPGEIKVLLDDTELTLGEDYLVKPNSAKVHGEFKLIWYTDDNIPTKTQLKKLVSVNFFTDKFIVIDSKDKENEAFSMLRLNLFGAAGIIYIEDHKLTHSISLSLSDFPQLILKRESIDRSNKTIEVSIHQKFIRNYKSQNVIGYIRGIEHPDSFIVLSAHYDHLGRMGNDVYFPGANDNASGIALLLDLAAHYSHKNPPTKTIIFIAFGAEESGLIGSKYFVENPLVPLKEINFVFNMDLMGTGSEGATIVNGAIYNEHYEHLVSINQLNNYLPVIKKRGKAANSDHYWFSENNIPSFFIYLMGGIKAYHDVHDVSNTLPLTEYEDSFKLIRDFVNEL